ncbi:MAG: hypothetical protein E7321_01665 [Clostridiales bacterium]|nr:hypothetical protein [Clostridiales bacterium]
MRRILRLLLLMLLVCSSAFAQHGDALDEAMRRLCVMSQQDEAFEGFAYNGGYISGRGCQPVSIANAMIASFGVENRETAIELVKETTQVLVVEHMRGEGRVELTRVPLLLSAQERSAEAQEHPYLAALIGPSASTITEEYLDAQMVAEHFAAQHAPALLVGRQSVHPEWEPMMEIVHQLYDMGLSDATLCLASVGVGRKDSGTPLASGKNGHYLSILIHVGTFMQDGRVYVLDSLPRALADEESGFAHEMHEAYPFARKHMAFGDVFDVERISKTVLRLTQRAQTDWKDAPPQEKARRMRTLLLYGPGVLMIHAPGGIKF